MNYLFTSDFKATMELILYTSRLPPLVLQSWLRGYTHVMLIGIPFCISSTRGRSVSRGGQRARKKTSHFLSKSRRRKKCSSSGPWYGAQDGTKTRTTWDHLLGRKVLGSAKVLRTARPAIAHCITEIVGHPAILVSGMLKEKQAQCLWWMVSLYDNALDSILADKVVRRVPWGDDVKRLTIFF